MKAVSIALFAGLAGCAFAQPVQAAAAYKVLWSFGNGTDGQGPSSALLNVDGVFYGTTRGGGIYGDGTAYAFDPGTDAEKVLYTFCIKGEFCLDGSEPSGGLIDVKGKLYGTTAFGGANLEGEGGGGTVFSLNPSTGKEKVVYSFCQQTNCTDGSYPAAGVIDVKGTFFGTTDSGGSGNGRQGFSGTAFALDRKTGTESVLYSFCSQQHCTDGSNLETNAQIDVKGTLYGTTGTGGADYTGCQNAGCGTIYAIDQDTGAETVLHSFQGGTDGAEPSSGLIDVKGVLYGTTAWGGGSGCFNGYGCGTVYSFDPGTGVETVLYSFCEQANCADGAFPGQNLIAIDGVLYGISDGGGSTGCTNGCGTVFSFDPGTGAESVLYAFCSQANCADGSYPGSGLTAVKGVLYGVTDGGGAYGYGTLFSLGK